MIDIFIGKPPTQNRHVDDAPFPIQNTVRELLRIARNIQHDRRKNTSDRRHLENEDYLLNLSHRRRKRRISLDRRQNLEFLVSGKKIYERRKKRFDRRKQVNDGVIVKLSSRHERRSSIDRRE